jgi:capsular polysaccharide transport system ATP-binding protein
MISDKPLIVFDRVVRRIEAAKERERLLLDRVSWQFWPNNRLAILATNQEEADAFLACAAGIVPAQEGSVQISSHVSWPIGEPEALLGALTARENAIFLQRIYGSKSQRKYQIDHIRELCDFEGDFFDKPLKAFNKAMKARFRLAVSLVFDFDLMVVPKLSAWNYGSKSCRSKRFQAAFEAAIAGKPLLVSHPDPSFQNAYCDQSIVLDSGRIVYQGDLCSGRSWLKEYKQHMRLNAPFKQPASRLIA